MYIRICCLREYLGMSTYFESVKGYLCAKLEKKVICIMRTQIVCRSASADLSIKWL